MFQILGERGLYVGSMVYKHAGKPYAIAKGLLDLTPEGCAPFQLAEIYTSIKGVAANRHAKGFRRVYEVLNV